MMKTKTKPKVKAWGKDKIQHKEVAIDEVQLVRSICKESFYEFVREFWDTISAEKPIWNWHVKYLCDNMQRMAERVFKGKRKKYDLLVNISPGTTKSTIMSIMFPIWCWTRMPSFQFIGASYSHDIAQDLSQKSRDVVKSEKFQRYFPEIQLRSDQDTKSFFKNTKGGWRYSVGINGSVTGKHAHFIVIDDPLDPQMATSAANIKEANAWIINTLSNRKVRMSVSPMALVMQRLHQDDPSAYFIRLAKKGYVKWICLPAILTDRVHPPGLAKMYHKGIMNPGRHDRQTLRWERMKGEMYWGAQFLQDPVPPGGNLFKTKRIKYGVPPDKWKRLVRFWDKAGTKGGGAYTVGTLMGMDVDGRIWVLDVVRGQWDSFERERIIRRTAELDGYEVQVGVEQEPGSGGKESAENTVRSLAGFRVKVVKVDVTTGGKLQRADPFSSQVNAGNVYLPKGSRWAKAWIEEFKYFPNSKYMDQIDSGSGAFSMVFTKKVYAGGLKSRFGKGGGERWGDGSHLGISRFKADADKVKVVRGGSVIRTDRRHTYGSRTAQPSKSYIRSLFTADRT